MAETFLPNTHCVYVETNLGTRLGVLFDDCDTVFDFKGKLCKEHHQCFPKLGKIDISAIKVTRQRSGVLLDFHLPNSMLLSMVFKDVSKNSWLLNVDAAVRIVELPKADLEEIAATNSLLLAEKRKLEVSDGENSRKKPKVDDLSQSAAASDLSPREKQDEALTEAPKKYIEVGEKSLGDEVRDKTEPSNNLVSHTENHLDTEKKKKKRRKKRSKGDDISQSSTATAITTSRDTVKEIDGVPANPQCLQSSNFDDSSSAEAARQKENDMGENVVEDVGRDKIVTDNLMENLLDTKDDVNQSLAAAAALTDIVNEINRVPANVDYVDDSFDSLPVPRGEIPFVKAASQKDIGMCDDDDINQSSDAAVLTSRDVLVNQNNEVPANATPPIAGGTPFAESSQKENEPDKSSKDEINQSIPAATGSGGIVNEIKGVAGNENHLNGATLSISTKRENLGIPCAEAETETGEKMNSTNDSFLKKDTTETDAEEKGGDIGDNFGSSQNPDQVGGGGVKSIREKSGLDLHPSASTNVSLSSLKPKKRKSRVQQSACSGTYCGQQSRVKSVSVGVKSKKQDVKETSSNLLTVDKMKTNFFKDAEKCNSSEDEHKKTSHVSTKTQGNQIIICSFSTRYADFTTVDLEEQISLQRAVTRRL